MLRAKHLGPLSQTARSFFLNGSRCSAGDGSSCSCSSEDEKCISRRPFGATVQASSSLLSKTSVGVASLDPLKESNAKKRESVPSPHPPSRTDTVDYTDGTDASPHIADTLVRAGMVAVGLLSDLANYRIPMSEGSALLSSSSNSVIDRPTPVSGIRSSDIETSEKDKVSVKPCSTSNGRAEADKSYSVKVTNESDNVIKFADACGQNRPVPQRSNGHPKCISGKKSERFSRAIRQPGTAPPGRQFMTPGSVVETVSRILCHYKWSLATEEALGQMNCSIDAYQANQILKQLQDHVVALAFFHWLKRQPRFKHDGHTYTTMVGILGRARQFTVIKKLLDMMIDDGCEPNVVTFNRLIHSYGKANYLNEAMGVFNQMRKSGCVPDRVTYCTLIDIHAKAGYLDVAMDLYERMQAAGLSPDTFTYSVIMNCLGKAGHLDEAQKVFSNMVKEGCVPNLVTYNIMIGLQAKARNYESALQLYRGMRSAGFLPDQVTYSIVMEVLGHCGYLEEAEGVFREMKRKKWVPDERVYGLLVDLWGKVGNAEKAWEWYGAMVGAGLCPNVPTCNSLLSAFLRVRRWQDAYDLLRSMLSLGLKPSLQTYTLLLSCCTEARTRFDMSFCRKLMMFTGHPAHNFLVSMPAPGPDGQNVRDHVSEFLDMMHSEDRESKRGLVDAVIDFFRKMGLKEEAGSIWEVAAGRNVYPDAVKQKSSSYWLINLHVMSDGTAVTALSRTLAWFRREMVVLGRPGPSRIDIVTGWGRRSRVTGSSLVRQSVEELLNVFGFPFFTENGNSGCFVGCGESLHRWLLQSYVDRMHLL